MKKIEKLNFKPNENFVYLLYWMTERMDIFMRRYKGEQFPYTEDNILKNNKFTNVYRSLDRVSQYLIKEIINKDENYSKEDLFWRILIFRHFNKIETWQWLMKDLGDITFKTKKEDLIFSLKKYSDLGNPVYNNAFMLTAPFMRKQDFMKEFGLIKGSKKYDIYLRIFYKHFIERKNIYKVLEAKSLEDLYNKLREVPAFANFLAMQFTTDFNWSSLFNFNENDFDPDKTY